VSPAGRFPHGAYVLVAGPDGTGKSTLVRRLVQLGGREFAAVRTMHWRPGVLPRLGSLAGAGAPDATRPHSGPPYGRLLSLVRLGYYWLDQVIGFWLVVSPSRRRGELVIIERGYWDMVVDPLRYRLGCAPAVVRFLGRLVPHPDLTVILGGDPAAIATRKGELPAEEIARQLGCWRQFDRFGPTLLLDELLTEREVFDQVCQRLLPIALSERQGIG
jgi:thymidylate kinase